MQAIYNYQRVILEAFTQVINRMTTVENYSRSIELKKQQMATLEKAVVVANDLYQNARPGVDFLDVLTAQQALRDARVALIDTKTEQLAAIVNTYQALGGGVVTVSTPAGLSRSIPVHPHGPRRRELRDDRAALLQVEPVLARPSGRPTRMPSPRSTA